MTYIGETLTPEPASPGLGHNAPPLDQLIVEQFEDSIDAKPNLRKRIGELIEKGATLPECADDETAGKLGDFIKMCGAAADAVDEIRQEIKKPYLTATRALDAKAKGYDEGLDQARRAARARLNPYVQEQERLRREREAEERRLQAEREAAAAPVADAIETAVAGVESRYGRMSTPAAPERPAIARGDAGARVGSRIVWKHEIVDIKKLPKDVMQHPKVIEALNSVIGARVRAGEREMKGVRIFETTEASVR